MTDAAAIRAEGRRLVAKVQRENSTVGDFDRWEDFCRDHADALLADPAPEGLSEEEIVSRIVESRVRTEREARIIVDVLRSAGLIDRLSASTEEGTDPPIPPMTNEGF